MRDAALFIASQSGSAEAGILHTVFEASKRAYRSWKNRRQVAELGDFDDHMLADIGLTRNDVREALDLPFSVDPGRELQRRACQSHPHGWNV